jgi:hypothetical protein
VNRELDPQIFGPGQNLSSSLSPNASTGSGAPNAGSRVSVTSREAAGFAPGAYAPTTQPSTQPSRPVPYPPLDLKVLEAQMSQMRQMTAQFDRRLEQLQARFNELSRDTQGRLDRYGHQLLRLEDGISRLTEDTAQRFAQVVGKVNERKLQDSKVQEMLDRHNILVRNFENRLAALQKLTSDQEQALLSAHAALEDARAELARLKRI